MSGQHFGDKFPILYGKVCSASRRSQFVVYAFCQSLSYLVVYIRTLASVSVCIYIYADSLFAHNRIINHHVLRRPVNIGVILWTTQSRVVSFQHFWGFCPLPWVFCSLHRGLCPLGWEICPLSWGICPLFTGGFVPNLWGVCPLQGPSIPSAPVVCRLASKYRTI